MNLLRKAWTRMFIDDREVLAPVRGRVARVSTLTNGETSVVLHFGVEEIGRRQFKPGQAIESRVVVERPKANAPAEPGAVMMLEPDQRPTDFPRARAKQRFAAPPPLCNCGATIGKPHEPDCIWWDAVDRRQKRYDELLAEEYGKPVAELTAEDRASEAILDAHERAVRRLTEEDARA